jgi:hypothetical protein
VRLARYNQDTDPSKKTPLLLELARMTKHGRHSIEFEYKPTPGDKFWDSPVAVGEVFKIWWDSGGSGHTLIFHKLASIKVHYAPI